MALSNVGWLFVVLSSAAVIICNGLQEGDVKFNLFTKNLNDTEVYENNSYIIDVSLPTLFIIHGWEVSSNASWVVDLTNAYLSTGSYNVITVDWSRIAYLLYPISAAEARNIGNYVGNFILNLHAAYNANLKTIHLVGHSLGAQISGFAGKLIQNATGVNLSRITGLDPAGPLYRLAGERDRLAETDADLVVVLHTDGGVNGYLGRLGDLDFYANGGVPVQPGCLVATSCSHMRATEYFIESVYNPSGFLSTECGAYVGYLFSICNGNRNVTLGGELTIAEAGEYYFTTNAQKPYSKN